jgi:DNA-directed RNA polymerase subunit RPC12/RpoP
MSNGTYFVQECPTCGRRLHIRVEYLGRSVVCQHCRGRLMACDPASRRLSEASAAEALLRRAEELLRHASECETRSRLMHPR